MSYRIKLSIVNKEDFDHNKNYDWDSLYDMLEKYDRHELYDETDVSQFTQIRGDFDEYHPAVLDKDQFRILIKWYQHFIHENYVRKNEMDNGDDRYLDRMFEYYFEALIERDVLIKPSSVFILDYFYLVSEYEKFDDEKHVAIITHG